jgi:hypothetical protein
MMMMMMMMMMIIIIIIIIISEQRTVKFCKLSMEKWSTKLQLKSNQEFMQSSLIRINRGIFQGDSLLPLLFCASLIPLTHELNRSKCGYQVYGTHSKINHLLYTDDLKLEK